MPTFVAPAQVVAPIVRTPLPYGLFSVLGFRGGDDRWRNGITWEPLTCDALGGIAQWYCPNPGINEVQTLTFGGAGLTSYTLTYAGQTTTAIATGATAATVQAALIALSNIGPNDVVVAGSQAAGFTVTFTGTLGGTNVAQLTATPTGGTGTVTPATTIVGVPAEGLPAGLPKSLGKTVQTFGAAKPFSIYGHYTCSPIANDLEFSQGRAEDHLTSREEITVEAALWTGAYGASPNFAGANGYAAPASAGTFTKANASDALAAVEQYLATNYGSQGVIHMSRELATVLSGKMVIDSKGSRLYTKLGTPIVAGAGYDSTKIVGSAALDGYRSEIFIPSNVPYDLLNRANNDLVSVAEREYVVAFDPCGLVSATISG